ncbi:MobV family relaxase [Metaclostridioides mangenotii]|uniref:MobV family relaxase n=1 Tax=Metaclostridioides mangenotii TaxID=1540 RepID=UPI0031E34B59
MSYAILRIERVKRGGVSGIQKHVERENENYSNKDIDLEKTKENYSLMKSELGFLKRIDFEIEKRYTSNRKIRTDAIVMFDGIVTSDKNFFDGLCKDKQKRYFETSLDFIKNRFGKENIIYANVHMDEKTPHMHFGVVPITKEGKLSARDMLNGSRVYRELQDNYYKHVTDRGYELDRGLPKEVTNNKHKDIEKYKNESINSLDFEIEKLKEKKKIIEQDLKESLKLEDKKIIDKNFYNNHKVKIATNIETEPHRDLVKKGIFKTELAETDKSILKNNDISFMKNLIKDQALIINQLTGSNEIISDLKNNIKDKEIEEVKKENIVLQNQVNSLQNQQFIKSEKLKKRMENDYKNTIENYKKEIEYLNESGKKVLRENFKLTEKNMDLEKENKSFRNTLDKINDFLEKFNLLEKYKTYRKEKEKLKNRNVRRSNDYDYER